MTNTTERELRRERAAKNQSFFREINERIQDLAGNALSTTFICECLQESCSENVSMTLQEYEQVRKSSNSFFVLPGHELAEVEGTLEQTDRFLIVAKLGAGGRVAEHLDPRRRPGPGS